MMQNKTLLYTNGDSWTYGEGLKEEQHPFNEQSYKFYNTWPWHVKEHYNIPQLINDGKGGGSNVRMYRRTIEFIQNYNNDLSKVVIIIGWTSSERQEIPVPVEVWSEDGVNSFEWTERQYWAWSHSSSEDEDILKNVYKPKEFSKTITLLKHPSVDMSITKNLMWGLQEVCKANNIELHQFMALHCAEFEPNDPDYDPVLTKNIKYHTPSFLAQIRNTKELLKCKHPNELGHKNIADFIIQKIGDGDDEEDDDNDPFQGYAEEDLPG